LRLAWPFLAAYLLDLVLGDPPHWPHPVRLIGRICQYWEATLYRPQVQAGALYWLGVMGTTLVLIFGVLGAVGLLPTFLGAVIVTYFLYAGLATRSLHLESRLVEEALARGDLKEARAHLAMIVGRDTAKLSAEDIRRAVLETVAENLADGVVAPMFFTLLVGLPGMFGYKAANTMDSMVGYKNFRYRKFGKVAARVDDALNFLPARLTALLMVLTAPLLGLDLAQAWRILRRDAAKAGSPNAGWPEAALAGALRVRLGGPSSYFGRVVPKAFIGEPGPPLGPEHYAQAIRLLYATSLIMALITFLALTLSSARVWGLAGVFF